MGNGRNARPARGRDAAWGGMRDHIPRVAGFAQAGQTPPAGKGRTIRARGAKDRRAAWHGDGMRHCPGWQRMRGQDARLHGMACAGRLWQGMRHGRGCGMMGCDVWECKEDKIVLLRESIRQCEISKKYAGACGYIRNCVMLNRIKEWNKRFSLLIIVKL